MDQSFAAPAALQENLQRVREQYARYNAGERAPGAWFWHEDAEYHTAREDPDHAVHRGRDAIGKLFVSWLEAYPDLRLEIQEAEARGDKVFLWIRFTGQGATSGIPSRWNWPTSLRSATARRPAWSSTWTATKPSKPWGCRSGRGAARGAKTSPMETYGIPETAALLELPPPAVRTMIEEGELEARQIDGRWRVTGTRSSARGCGCSPGPRPVGEADLPLKEPAPGEIDARLAAIERRLDRLEAREAQPTRSRRALRPALAHLFRPEPD